MGDNMRYHIDSMKLEEFIEKANGCLDKMNDQVKAMKDLITKTKWQGNAYEAALVKYNNLIKEIEGIPYTINLYIKFVETVVEKYGEGNAEIMKSFKEIVEKLELARLKHEI